MYKLCKFIVSTLFNTIWTYIFMQK